MGKATVTPINASADWPPEQILGEAAKRKFGKVMVVGWLEDASENESKLWVSASMNSDAESCDLLSLAHKWLMDQRIDRLLDADKLD